MPSLKDLRNRIASVKATRKITKAMQMVAASKMRKAQQGAVTGRPYADALDRILAGVSQFAGDFTHPLMEQREVRARAVVIVSTDKGLCGTLNSSLLREVAQFDPAATRFIAAGRKGAQYIVRTQRTLVAEFAYHDTPRFAEARAISKLVQDLFCQGEVDQVDLLFTRFVSTVAQRPTLRPFLPVDEKRLIELIGGRREPDKLMKGATEFLFEPSAAQVFGALLPHYLNFEMFQVLLESKASEHSARMVAMKNATDNAHQLIKDLTLHYNKMRQAAITNELLEIATAAMALE